MKQNGLFVWAALLLVGMPGRSVHAADTRPLRELTEADAASWKAIETVPPALTPDGNWLAYLVIPDPDAAFQLHPQTAAMGEVVVVLRGIRTMTERRYAAGELSYGAGNLKMSPSGRWLAFAKTPNLQAGEKLKAGGLPIHSSVVIWNIALDKKMELPEVADFSFVGERDEKILLKHYSSGEDGGAFDIDLRSLAGTDVQTFNGITAYAVNPGSSRLVMIGAEGVQLYDSSTGNMQTLDTTPRSTYSRLTWSERGEAVAMLRKSGTGTRQAMVVFTQLAGSQPTVTVLDPNGWAGFPQGYELADSLIWRDAQDGVFFGIRVLPKTPVQRETTPNLILWHSKDELVPVERQAEAGKRPTFWCFVSLLDRRFVRLADETLPTVEPHPQGSYVLGYDARPYGWFNAPDGDSHFRSRDYYRIDLQNGERRPIFKGLQVLARAGIYPRLSPDGAFVIYRDNAGDYVAYELKNGRQRNLTEGLPTHFYFDENPPKTLRQMKDPPGAHGIQGWTEDGAFVLISDGYDIWKLPLHGGRAMNLTGNGRKDDINYGLSSLSLSGALNFMPGVAPNLLLGMMQEGRLRVSAETTLYFSALDFKTGRRGLARRVPGGKSLDLLSWDYASFWYFKAKQADVYICLRTTSVQPWDYYLLDSSFHPSKRLSDVNPQQREFQWSAGTKYLSYKTVHGETSHALLYLPTHFVEGRSYPTVMWIYAQQTGRLHDYSPFRSDLYPWLQRDYAVLEPDIVPRVNEAGRAALESVTGAVDAAVATGIVDRSRLGLAGHSFGGWETYFIVSQTNLFKAAVPYAGMANLWSSYGALNDTTPNSLLSETSQPFLAGPWWEQWDAYLQNSPLYYAPQIRTPLLIVHGDKDTAVPFSQGVEMFNNLRRMGNKQVVLLQYVGEEHNLDHGDGRAERDFQQRMLQFFDHFLKGAPAPAWWADGVSYYQDQVPAPSVSSGH